MTESWRDVVAVAAKDLLIERRTRVTINQITPLGLLILVVFAFAFDANQLLLDQAAPGLFWVAVLFAGLMTIQRSFALESGNGLRDALRLSGIEPAAMFVGKAIAILVQLLVLEFVLIVAVMVMYDASIDEPLLVLASAVAGTTAFAFVGCIYGAVSLGLRVRETLLPLLLIPVVAPILLAGTRAMEAGFGLSTQPGWSWVGLLVATSVIYAAIGLTVFGPLLEDG